MHKGHSCPFSSVLDHRTVPKILSWPDTPSHHPCCPGGVLCPPRAPVHTCTICHGRSRMLRAVLRRKPPSPVEGPSRMAPGCGAPSAPSRRCLFLRARRCRACSCHFFLWNRSQTSHSSWDRWWHRSRGCKHGKHNQGARGKTGLCFHGYEAAWLPNVSPSSSELKTQVRSPQHSGGVGDTAPAVWAWPGPYSSAHHATCPAAPYLGGSEGRRPPQDLLPGHRQLQVL